MLGKDKEAFQFWVYGIGYGSKRTHSGKKGGSTRRRLGRACGLNRSPFCLPSLFRPSAQMRLIPR